MEVISINPTGAMSLKEQLAISKNLTTKSVGIVDSREDCVPELYAASDSGSMDSFEAGRSSTDEASMAVLSDTTVPVYARAKSADNIVFSKGVSNNDLQFSRKLDEEGQKELMMFLQAPSSVILQSILEYQPTASFGFVKTHVHDGLSDDENPEYDADDMTAAIFPTKTARYAAAGTAATATATRSDLQRDSMPAAVRHFTPDPNEQRKQKAAAAAASTGVVSTRSASRRSTLPEQMDPQRAAMPAAVRYDITSSNVSFYRPLCHFISRLSSNTDISLRILP